MALVEESAGHVPQVNFPNWALEGIGSGFISLFLSQSRIVGNLLMSVFSLALTSGK
jgi:hypothetical protein